MIDVDIPLNRWGDHDPAGKMYALTSQIPAIRAEEASREVSLGLRDDPIQPLVIRANEGDCVQINLTNKASGGTYGIHIDGLPYDRAGDKVGRNFSGEVPSGQSAVFRYMVPTTRPRGCALHQPRRGIARLSTTGCSACCRSSLRDRSGCRRSTRRRRSSRAGKQ
jgi:hypothetical protein